MSAYRSPKIINQKRADAILLVEEDALEYSVRPRSSRGGRHSLPTDRDSVAKSGFGDRSWKRYRGFQYKIVSV